MRWQSALSVLLLFGGITLAGLRPEWEQIPYMWAVTGLLLMAVIASLFGQWAENRQPQNRRVVR